MSRRPQARSFRLRLAVFSALVSGVILLTFGFAAWFFTYNSLLDSVDSRLVGPGERNTRRIHAGIDWDRFREMSRMFGREVTQDMNILVVENTSGKALYNSRIEDEEAWVVDESMLKAYMPTPEQLADAPPVPQSRERSGGGGRGERSPGGSGNPPTGTGRESRPEGGGARPERPPRFPGDRRSSWHILGEPQYFTMTGADGVRWRTVAMSNSSVTVFTAMDLAEFDSDARKMRSYFLAALPLGLLAIAAGAWAISRRAMRPLDRIMQTASGMSAADLGKRIPVTGEESGEFAELVAVLNAMMERLEGSFHQATRFTADASHELKTPIAIMQAEIESALKSCTPDSPEEASLLNLLEENQRLKRITQSLLLLSQVDSGKLKLAEEHIDLSAELEALAEDAEHLCAKQGLTFSSEISAGVEVTADRVLLMQALQNLLSNAIKYNCQGGSVSCSLSSDGREAVVGFHNSGPPIPEDEQSKIFDRFYRVDKARGPAVEGFGLGLNLSLEIVRAHGGSLELVSSDAGGTRMELRLAL